MTKTIDCLHTSDVKTTAEGELQTCYLCGQQILITPDRKENIIKRGQIFGVKTNIHPVANHSTGLEQGGSKEPPAPPRPSRPKKRKELPQYYESNKETVLADYHLMNLKDFFRKWHLSTQYWIKLKKQWRVVGKHSGNPIASVSVLVNAEDSLPPLPAFSDKWTETVQVEWLRTYRELRLA